MPVRIRVRNFQSLKDVSLTVEGFTVLTGTNNAGKSAVVRAVQGVFSNALGDSCVRHGEDHFTVDLDLGPEAQVSWQKGLKIKPTYVINGKTLHPGRAVPDEVLALGIQPITVGTATIWPQIAPQFTGQIFLLDMSGASVVDALADVERVGKLNRALRLAESDKRAATTAVSLRKQDLDRVQADLLGFAGLDEVGELVRAVESRLQEVQKTGAQVVDATLLRSRLLTARETITKLQGVRSVRVPSSTQVDEARGARTSWSGAIRLRQRLVAQRAEQMRLIGVKALAVPGVPSELQALQGSITTLRGLQTRLQRALAVILRGRDATSVVGQVQRRMAAVPVEKAQKARTLLAQLVQSQTRLAQGRAEVARVRRALSDRRAALDKASQHATALLVEAGVCPTCRADLQGGSHAHGGGE